MSQADVPFMIRNFLGVNRRDGGERVGDNEFWKIQNFYPASKGLFYKRYGSTADLSSGDLFGAAKVTAMKRFYTLDREFVTLYHCEPNATPLADPTVDLGLAEISGGDLFNGGAVEVMRFCYTFVGLGLESNFNTRNRVGYTPANVNAWTQTAHQSITVSSNTKGVRVTAPATFPSGVRMINVFAARGSSSQMTYVGSITEASGTLDVICYIAPNAAMQDSLTVEAFGSGSGSLEPGTYYVAFAPVADHGNDESFSRTSEGIDEYAKLSETSVTLDGSSSRLMVRHLGVSANGSIDAYVFVGRKSGAEHPLMFAGIVRRNTNFFIEEMPDYGNAQSHPVNEAGVITSAFNTRPFSENSAYLDRHGFFVIKRADGTVAPMFMSRTGYMQHKMDYYDWSTLRPLHGVIATPADTSSLIDDWEDVSQGAYADPTIVNAVGLNYMVNGFNEIIQIDNHCVGFMVAASGVTCKPPIGSTAVIFKNQLVIGGSACGSQIYASNTFAFNNFAAGGTGSALRFANVGNPTGEPITCLGVSSFTSATDGPSSRIAAFKSNRAWTLSNIPDPSSGIGASMDALSAEAGVAAARSFVNTPIGPIFLAGNADVYILRQGEPYPIGGKVRDLLKHMEGNAELMQMCSAVYHDHFYKLSYPSSSDSTYADAQIWADLRTQDGDRVTWNGPHTGVSIAAQITFDGEGDNGHRYAVRGDALGTMRLDDPSTFQDLGSAITSVIETKTFRHRAEMNLKRWLGMLLDAYYDTQYTHSVLLELFADDQYSQNEMELSDGAATWDASSFDTSNWGDAMFRAVPWWLASNLIGRTLKAKITHASNAQFIIAAIGLPYRPERRRIS